MAKVQSYLLLFLAKLDAKLTVLLSSLTPKMSGTNAKPINVRLSAWQRKFLRDTTLIARWTSWPSPLHKFLAFLGRDHKLVLRPANRWFSPCWIRSGFYSSKILWWLQLQLMLNRILKQDLRVATKTILLIKANRNRHRSRIRNLSLLFSLRAIKLHSR